jgi:hypothetical protein
MHRLFSLALALSVSTSAAHADEVRDTIASALAAYDQGDIAYAMQELSYVQQLMLAMKADGLAVFLPPAPDGWTREISTEASAAMSMMGGGTGAEATYSGSGQEFTITFTADSPMIGMFSGMLGNTAMMSASGAKTHRLGRERFMEQNGELTGLIDNRILIQASGVDVEIMLPLIESIDFRELGRFGS